MIDDFSQQEIDELLGQNLTEEDEEAIEAELESIISVRHTHTESSVAYIHVPRVIVEECWGHFNFRS